MSSFVDVANEIKSAGVLVHKRCRAGGKADASQLQAKLATQLANKISTIHVLDSAGAGTLYDAVQESGLEEKNAQLLVTAVDEKMLATSEAVQDTAGSSTQVLINPEKWMTPSLVEGLQDPRKSFDAKLQLTADFLSLCGCNHPHEKTFKWWFAAVLASHFTGGLPNYQCIFEQYTAFKQIMETCRTPWRFPKILHYPQTPNQLPDAVFSHIYSDELPVTVSIARLSVIASHHIPQRKNNRLLVGGTALFSAPPDTPKHASTSRLSPRKLAPQPQLSLADSGSPSSNSGGQSQSQIDPATQLDSPTAEPDWVQNLKDVLRPTKVEVKKPQCDDVKTSRCVHC